MAHYSLANCRTIEKIAIAQPLKNTGRNACATESNHSRRECQTRVRRRAKNAWKACKQGLKKYLLGL